MASDGDGDRSHVHCRMLPAFAAGLCLLIFAQPQAAAAKTMCYGRPATIVGTPGNDELQGERDRRNVIAGLGGRDKIKGLNLNDVICGGSGRDIIDGGLGSDKILGGRDDDVLEGEDGNDLVAGEAGDDGLYGDSIFALRTAGWTPCLAEPATTAPTEVLSRTRSRAGRASTGCTETAERTRSTAATIPTRRT